MNEAALPVLAAFLTSVLAVPVARRLAFRVGAVVVPRTDRWNRHHVPTLGGLAIAAGVIVGVIALPIEGTDKLATLAGLLAMVLLGLADDLRSVAPKLRILFESAIGVLFTIAVTGDLDTPLRIAAVLLAAPAIPVAVNATNLVDNADGLAASLSIVTAATLAAVAIVGGVASASAPLALVVAAACGGFLVFNLPPARVFMGDSGSLMLGFGLAAASIILVRDAVLLPGDVHVTAALVMPLAWAVQLGDLLMVVVTRLRRGASPFRGDVDHTSHRLMAAGLGPWRMLFALWLLAGVVGVVGVASVVVIGDFRLVAVVGIAALLTVGGVEALVARWLPQVGATASRQIGPDQEPEGDLGSSALGLGSEEAQ